MSRSWITSAAVLVAVGASSAYAQPAPARALTGSVVDATTGLPVVGALVATGVLEVTTDERGEFVLADAGTGWLDVVVVADGYDPLVQRARAGARITLKLSANSLLGGAELITIEETREVDGRPPTYDVTADVVRTLPGSGNDALKSLQSLPGTARVPFGLGGLVVRGAAPRDTNIFLDGIEVPILYHFGGLASFLPTDAVDEIELAPGGASVRYGRGLGGVALVTSRTGRKDRWRVGAELSLIHAATLAEGPGPLDGTWLVGVRRSYFDAIQEAASLDQTLAPRYGDAQLRWESGDGAWTALLFGSDDKLRLLRDPNDPDTGGIDTSNVKSFTYVSRFARLGVRYRKVFGSTQFTVLPSVGIDDVNGRANHNDEDKGMHRTTIPLNLRVDLATPLARGTLHVGLDGGTSRHAYEMLNTPPPSREMPNPTEPIRRSLTRWTADLGAFVEQSWFFLDQRLEVRPGLRGDHFGLSDQWTLDPRLVVYEHLPHGIELTQAIGRYHAPPLITDLDPIFGDRRMLGSSATQFATTIKTILGDDKEVSATAYYQDLEDLPVDAVTGATPISANGGTESGGALGISRELVDTQFGSYSYREAIGTGHAYGVELIARKTVGTWTGWVAYTYGRSFRKNPTIADTFHPYVLDQPNTVTLVASTALPHGVRAGGRFRYATGNPFTPVAGAVMTPDGKYRAIDGPLLSERLPDFVQLDLRVDKIWKRSWGTLDLYLDVQNVTWRDNIEGVTYNTDYTQRSYTKGLPIFPSLGVVYVP